MTTTDGALKCLAFDLGASGGRLMLGSFDGKTVQVCELHRFQNDMVRLNGVLYWDIFKLCQELKNGLTKAAALGLKPVSIGIDTWGVDYGLLDNMDNLIGVPIAYRDSRTAHCLKEADELVGLDRIYAETGIQFMEFNTLFQLMADKNMRPSVYENAHKLLFMPDLLGFYLTGIKYNEYTIMSTGQVLDPRQKKPANHIMGELGLRTDLFCHMVMPGTKIGALSPEITLETGVSPELIAVGSHDTASAVAGAPLEGSDAAFLSCGTWSLLGMEVSEPIISPESFGENFTNEGGVGGRIRFLKNINGLWIIQQIRKSYGNIPFEDIIAAARVAKDCPFEINPNDQRFIAPDDMCAEIVAFCEAAGQGRPDSLGEIAIAAYNGISREYGSNIKKLEKLVGTDINAINMIGGGIRDSLICQLTAEKTGKTLIAGPVEGSVFGNIITQLMALGEISCLEQGRAIINLSCEKNVYYTASR